VHFLFCFIIIIQFFGQAHAQTYRRSIPLPKVKKSEPCIFPAGIKADQEAAKYYIEKAKNASDHEAAALYSRSVECDPFFRAEPWIFLTRRALKNDFRKASEYFLKKAVALSPNSPEVLLLKAQLSAVKGNYKKAFKICRNLMTEKPKKEVLECVAENGMNIQEIKIAREALRELAKIFDEKPGSPKSILYFEMAKAYEMGTDHVRYGRGSDLDFAIDLFKKSYNHPKRHIWSSFHLALLFAEKKDYEKAVLWTDNFLTDYPGLDVAVYNKACFLAQLDRKEESLRTLRKAIDLGFRDRKHIENDSDLNNLKLLPKFIKVLESLPKLKDVRY